MPARGCAVFSEIIREVSAPIRMAVDDHQFVISHVGPTFNCTPGGVPVMEWRSEMTKVTKLMCAAAVVVSGGMATGAYADASTMTCGQFAAMNDVARMGYAHELLLWIADTANNEAAGAGLIGRYALGAHSEAESASDDFFGDPKEPWTHMQMKIEIEAHCIKHPADANIVERLKNS
jgi:hypothetical protein